jgi:MFS family permease
MILDVSPLGRHRDYRLLFAGQFVSAFGNMITYAAVPYQVFELTRSSLAVGMLGVVQLVPLVVFALWGGAYADAMDRRKLVIVSELLLTGASLALAVNSLLPRPSTWVLFAVTAVVSVVNGFHRPALQAMTPKLVDREDLTAVAALGTLSYSVAAIAGPASGGVLIASTGFPVTYGIDVATFVVSLVALAAMRSMPPAGDVSPPGLASIVEGLRYARSRPELIGTYVVDMVAMAFAMPMALFPAMAENWGGAFAAGCLYAAMPAGTLILSLLSGWTQRVDRHGAAVVIAAAIWGAAILGLGFASTLAGAVVCLAIAGAADTVSGIFRMTIWNQTIPATLRGRLAGVEMISYLSGPLVGNARAGWVASVSGNAWSLISGGLACVVGVLLCVPTLPAFWRYSSSTWLQAQGLAAPGLPASPEESR